VNLSKDHMQVRNAIETRLFHLDPHDKTPETREGRCQCIYGVLEQMYPPQVTMYTGTCKDHRHDCLPYDTRKRFREMRKV
jgi:hypothetical protein